MLSVIRRPRIKALCLGATMAGKIFFNRLARTFDIILYKTLHKLIGGIP
jgi:hypothetical protein